MSNNDYEDKEKELTILTYVDRSFEELVTDQKANLADSQSNVVEKEKLGDKKPTAGEGAKLPSITRESSDDFGKDEQERRTRVTVNIKIRKESNNIMGQLFKIINLVLKFDLRDDPSGGTYSLLGATYLKVKAGHDGIPLTEDDHVAARRLTGDVPYHVCDVLFRQQFD